MKGFFKTSDLQYKHTVDFRVPKCGQCKLYKHCRSPKMKPSGEGKKKILLLAETPSKQEDKKGTQMVGRSGNYLKRALKERGINMDRDCIKHNALACYIAEEEKRDPDLKEIAACKANTLNLIKEYKPQLIIALGKAAVLSLINHTYKKGIGGIDTWRGMCIPSREYHSWICPTYHPAYVIHDKTPDVIDTIFETDLDNALKYLNVPLPSFIRTKEEDKIEIIKHPQQVLLFLKDLQRNAAKAKYGYLTAFDYETTGLKPHRSGHKIRTCSISCGPEHAVSFSMDDEIIPAFIQYLKNPYIFKMAANIKFEHMWSSVILNTIVQGWFFDTMIAAHIINNRKGITGLKYQAFINFGIPPYDEHIKPLLKSSGGANGFNRIFEIGLEDLLIYNGMDSMLEFRLGRFQMELLKKQHLHLDFIPF